MTISTTIVVFLVSIFIIYCCVDRRLSIYKVWHSSNSFYDVSDWSDKDVDRFRELALMMYKVKDSLIDYDKIDDIHLSIESDQTALRRRLTTNDEREAEQRWTSDGKSLEKDMMEFFRGKQYDNKKEEVEIISATDKGRRPDSDVSSKVHRSMQTNKKCQDPTVTSLPCPPDNLGRVCDKYNGGKFSTCLQLCKPSFCCIHDSKATNPDKASCHLTEPNCRNYQACYIVWWKLQDTVGPANFLRIQQDDDFFDWENTDFAIEFNNPETLGFYLGQLYGHHSDDDTPIDEYPYTVTDEFFEDPANW